MADDARHNLEDLKLTPEEVNKFETAFKDPEFKKMFLEYAQEISDPKNKAESDAYLRQLEMEGKIESVYGRGVQLVMPVAGFVAKTTDASNGNKVFVNICHTDKCDDATSERRPGGLQWSVPHTLGQPHEEKDKAGKPCAAYDFCVSTKTYELTQRDDRLRTLVVETAIEAVNRAFGTELDTKFTLPKKKFVGPESGPGVQAIKGEKKTAGDGARGDAGAGPPAGRVAPLSAPAGAPPNGPGPDAPAPRASAFSFDKAVRRPAGKLKPAREPEGECEPRHEIIHREGGADLSKTFGNSSASREMEKRRGNRPSALVVRVHTPKIDGIAGAELDVGDKRLFFHAPGKYRLDLDLPFEVMSDDGKAKFDKSARRLEVTLPVKPAAMEPAPAFTEPAPEAQEDPERREAETSSASASQSVSKSDEADAPPQTPAPPAGAGSKTDDAEARAKASAEAAVAAKEAFEAFEASGETENQRMWREMHAKSAPPPPDPEPEPEPEPACEPTPDPAPIESVGHVERATNVSAKGDVPPPSVAEVAPPAPSVTYLRPSLSASAADDELD